MEDISRLPYLEWLEATLKVVVESKPSAIGIVTIEESGNVLTGFWNADAQDKAIMAHNMNAEAMLDVVLNNIGMVRDALDGLDDEGGGWQDNDD